LFIFLSKYRKATEPGVIPSLHEQAWGSDGSAACGGYSDLSEWQWSVCNAAALSARRTPGTTTGISWHTPTYLGQPAINATACYEIATALCASQ